MDKIFNGRKSIYGAMIAGAGAVLAYLGYPEQAKLVASMGATLFGIGIAHKMQKGIDNK
jgi:small-conductance mechanosensitive channel